MKTINFILLFTILICSSSLIFSQYQIKKDVFGLGGTEVSSTSYKLNSTLGQPIIGTTSGSTKTNYSGYWNPKKESNTFVNSAEPIRYELYQNYPNPFNPSTKIRYSIPTETDVVIKVYDILGKEIRTLINEEKSMGNYELEFDGSNLSSGVYFYKIQAGDFVVTKKMVLMK